MRLLVNMLLILSGVIGVAACNPDSADARPPQNTVATSQNAKLVEKDVQTPELLQIDLPADSVSTHVIEIHKMKFQTKILNVQIGDTITWINKDIVPHTATASDRSWDSGRLKKGENFSLTITDKTSLEYFCFYHRQMKAKLVLTSPT